MMSAPRGVVRSPAQSDQLTCGFDNAFFEDLSQMCLQSVAAGKLPTYKVISRELSAKHGEERFEAVKEDVQKWMQNFCAIQSRPSPGSKAERVAGVNTRKASYATTNVKPVFHKAHAHKVCPRKDVSAEDWMCDVCFAKQRPDGLRWRCIKECDWDCCKHCMNAYRGRKKTIKLMHRKTEPLGIIFSQLEVVGCYAGSIAEACGEILPGDYLLSFDGCELENFGRLTELVKAKMQSSQGGHNPNATTTTVLLFAEPYPHRDRQKEVVSRKQDSDPVASQSVEELEVEARLLRQSMESITAGGSPSDEEKELLLIMKGKVRKLEAEMHARRASSEADRAAAAAAAADSEGAESDGAGGGGMPSAGAVTAAIMATPRVQDVITSPPPAVVSQESALLRPDYRHSAKQKFAAHIALADKLSRVLAEEDGEEASSTSSVAAALAVSAVSASASASGGGGAARLPVEPPRPSARLSLVSPLADNSPFATLRRPSASSSASQHSYDAASPLAGSQAADEGDAAAGAFAAGAAAGALRSGVVAESDAGDAAAAASGPAHTDDAAGNDPPFHPARPPGTREREEQAAAAAAAAAKRRESVDWVASDASVLAQQLEAAKKSEAAAYKLLTKTNAKLTAAQAKLEAARAENEVLKTTTAERALSTRSAESTAAESVRSLQAQVDDLLRRNQALTAERDAAVAEAREQREMVSAFRRGELPASPGAGAATPPS